MTAAVQRGEKKLRRQLQNALGSITMNVQDGGRLGAKALDVFRAQIQGFIPGDGLPAIFFANPRLGDALRAVQTL